MIRMTSLGGSIATGIFLAAVSTAWVGAAAAQTTPTPTGAAPADVAGTVAAPKAPADAPTLNGPSQDSTNAAVSAGGQFQSGNSHLYAATGQGKFDMRRGANVFAAGLIGNYAETLVVPPAGMPGTPTPPSTWKPSTENLQGKLRYERYLSNEANVFLQLMGTHDAFQAVTFRLNVDPGFKLILVKNEGTRLWGEVGYDFQFTDNFTDSNGIEQAGAGGQALDSNNLPYLISRSDTIQSSRAFVGFRQAFNKEVQLSAGLEYLQGFGGSGGDPPAIPAGYTASTIDPVSISLKAARVNFDTLLAANVGAGFSLGVGFTAKYNSRPLPGKVDVDTMGTLAIIYTLANAVADPPKPPPACVTPPAPPPPPPVPPPAAPASVPAPATMGAPAPTPAPATMSPPAPATP